MADQLSQQQENTPESVAARHQHGPADHGGIRHFRPCDAQLLKDQRDEQHCSHGQSPVSPQQSYTALTPAINFKGPWSCPTPSCSWEPTWWWPTHPLGDGVKLNPDRIRRSSPSIPGVRDRHERGTTGIRCAGRAISACSTPWQTLIEKGWVNEDLPRPTPRGMGNLLSS